MEFEKDKIPYIVRKNYIPDFTIKTKDGRVMYLEVKGWFRSEDRSKMIAVKKHNPDLDIRFVFAKDNKLNKNSTTKYSDWCVTHDFPFCIGDVPKGWLS